MVIFVADYFVKEKPNGGSELSLQALIETCPYKYKKIKAAALKPQDVKNEDFIVFGNYNNCETPLLINIALYYNYVIVESDFKFCRYRSPQIHKDREGCDCNCKDKDPRSIAVFQFLSRAKHIFYKSLVQKEIYDKNFPFLVNVPNTVLSATFSDKDLDLILELRKTPKNGKYAVYNSKNIVKDYENNLDKCKKQGLICEGIGDLPRQEFLKKLAEYKGLWYFPKVEDTCPRLTCEAKLLRLDIVLGEFCLHKNEGWFAGSINDTEEYLRTRTDVFWDIIKRLNKI